MYTYVYRLGVQDNSPRIDLSHLKDCSLLVSWEKMFGLASGSLLFLINVRIAASSSLFLEGSGD